MDSIKGQGGIQMLLSAEQEARQIVSAARDLKIKRLKQAKDEAESDIALYRSHLEAEYQKSLDADHSSYSSYPDRAPDLDITSGSSTSNVQRLEEETEAKIKNMKESLAGVSPQIVEMVIKHITTVNV